MRAYQAAKTPCRDLLVRELKSKSLMVSPWTRVQSRRALCGLECAGIPRLGTEKCRENFIGPTFDISQLAIEAYRIPSAPFTPTGWTL